MMMFGGDFQKPSIYKVYHIGLNNETDIEIVRDAIYDGEKNGQWTQQSAAIEAIYGSELVREYTAENFGTFQELSRKQQRTVSKGYPGKNPRLRNGRGNASELGDHPVKTSSTDGVFFDEKKYSLSEVSDSALAEGEAIRYHEDIAPVMEAPVSKTETTVAENAPVAPVMEESDRKSTRLNSSH